MELLILDSAEDELRENVHLAHRFKKLTGVNDFYEFRVKHDTNIYRAIVGHIEPEYLIVLVFNKKTQKIPTKIINKAKRRFNNYKVHNY